MRFETLITPAELAPLLTDPQLLAVDCRFDLARPGAGEQDWRRGHVPGAVYAHLERDLSGPVTPQTGRHPLPSPQAFAATLSRWGIDARTQLVLYDDASGMFAARLWWMLRWLGHDAVAVLDGGLPAWHDSGGDIDTTVRSREPSVFQARLQPHMVVSTAEVVREMAERACLLVDARAPGRFRGDLEPIDSVAGHVPGAVNHPCQHNLGEAGRFLPADELAARWQATLRGRAASEVTCMCGSGVTACHDLLALEHMGLSGARLYAGSWSEWIRDPAREVARGDG